MSDNVLVNLASVPMATLFVGRVFTFVSCLVKKFTDFVGHSHRYVLSVNFNLYFHDFSVLSELVEFTEKTAGGERQRVEESTGNKKYLTKEVPHKTRVFLFESFQVLNGNPIDIFNRCFWKETSNIFPFTFKSKAFTIYKPSPVFP